MNPQRRKRLLLVLLLLAGISVAVGLVLYALNQNINLFYDPSQIVAGEAPDGVRIRGGGMVKEGTVVRTPETLKVQFDITDFKHTVTVQYEGILPDLFREGQGVVVEGKLENGLLVADQVLAKHDENYMPPEVAKSLKEQHGNTEPAPTQDSTP